MARGLRGSPPIVVGFVILKMRTSPLSLLVVMMVTTEHLRGGRGQIGLVRGCACPVFIST